MAKAVMLTAAVPSLYMVMLSALLVPGVWPGKLRLPGNSVIAWAAPVPLSAIVCVGLPGSLSFSVTAALWVPAAAAVEKMVVVEHRRPAGGVGQVLLCE